MKHRSLHSWRLHLRWSFPLAVLFFILAPANATTLAKLHLYELLEKATALARLRCLGSEFFWDKGEIWTNTRFEVLGQLKGRLQGRVVVRMLGGKLGHLNSRVEGAPAFQPGEEVYLFLWGPATENLGIVGWGQGTFRLRRDKQTGMETVIQDSTETLVFDALTREYSQSEIQNMPLPEFLEKLRKELARSNSGPTLRGSPIHAVLQPGKSSPPSRCSAGAMLPAETIAVRWSTALDANSVRILTREQTVDGRLDEIGSAIKRSFAAQPERSDSPLPQHVHAQVTRAATPHACGIDGVNSICFDQADMAFTPGVLGITRVVTSDSGGISGDGGAVAGRTEQVLDADIYFNPSNSPRVFATPAALAQNPRAFDLETVLIHEWRSALVLGAPASSEQAALSCSSLTTMPSGPIPQALAQR